LSGVVLLTILNELVLRELGVDQARPLIYGVILIVSATRRCVAVFQGKAAALAQAEG